MSSICCLPADRVFPAVRHALTAASSEGFRVIHFSVQNDHLHLLVEAETRTALSEGMRGLAIRIARAVNRALGRRGSIWGDRYHARPLRTPREVRHGLVYVLMNFKKHGSGEGRIDARSSAPWFNGWRAARLPIPPVPTPVVRARTWLAVVGWRRHGLIGIEERPCPR